MTGRTLILFAALAAAAEPAHSSAVSHATTSGESARVLSHDARVEFLRRAQVWTPTKVNQLDLRAGPDVPGAFAPDGLVECDFVPSPRSGSSKKFECRVADGRVVKIRYGADNPEVEGSILATRLLWALGFGADIATPVRLVCHGCSADPWNDRDLVGASHVFDVATVEWKMPGHDLKADPDGWAWPELDLVDDTQGGAPRYQRDALKLLAVFIQHTDNKAIQQRFHCLPGGIADDGVCTKPLLLVKDLGLTFGQANYFDRSVTSSVNFALWSRTPIWRDRAACIGHLARSSAGTLGDPKIGEAGRSFLSALLAMLGERQLHDLFAVGHVERRSRKPGSDEPPASVDDWVRAFDAKRADIAATRCPS